MPANSSSSPTSSASTGALLPRKAVVKRRQIRKGTFSCWECKRRKSRCEFKDGSGTNCVSCQRRGLSCVGQEFPEPGEEEQDAMVEDRVANMELLVNQLVRQKTTSAYNTRNSQSIPKSPSGPSYLRRPSPSLLVPFDLLGSQSLSSQLHNIFPPPNKVALILGSERYSKLPVHLRGFSKKTMSASGMLVSTPEIQHTPSAHPVQFARKFIQLALCTHQLDMSGSQKLGAQLNESVQDLARHYIEIASRHVTSQNSLMDSPDGLETLILEAVYHINVGDLRAAWLIFRRAIAIAQLMELHLPEKKLDHRLESIWFRLILGDRSISLTLGLPSDISDSIILNKSLDGSHMTLQYAHLLLLGRIITRNMRMKSMKQGDMTYDHHKETQDIDFEFKKATRSLPSKWWSTPNLDDSCTEQEKTENTIRLLIQAHHQLLLLFLHQPYFIPKPESRQDVDADKELPFNNMYSQMAVHAASKELITSFLVLRKFHRALSYRAMDDKALVACSMLVLVHMNGHSLGRENVLEHQRLQDLEYVKDVIDCIEETSTLIQDSPSDLHVELLKRLLKVEAKSVNGISYSIWIEEGHEGSQSETLDENEDNLSWPIPYFGQICVVRERAKVLSSPLVPNIPSSYAMEIQAATYSGSDDTRTPADDEVSASSLFDSISLKPHTEPINEYFEVDSGLALELPTIIHRQEVFTRSDSLLPEASELNQTESAEQINSMEWLFN